MLPRLPIDSPVGSVVASTPAPVFTTARLFTGIRGDRACHACGAPRHSIALAPVMVTSSLSGAGAAARPSSARPGGVAHPAAVGGARVRCTKQEAALVSALWHFPHKAARHLTLHPATRSRVSTGPTQTRWLSYE